MCVSQCSSPPIIPPVGAEAKLDKIVMPIILIYLTGVCDKPGWTLLPRFLTYQAGVCNKAGSVIFLLAAAGSKLGGLAVVLELSPARPVGTTTAHPSSSQSANPQKHTFPQTLSSKLHYAICVGGATYSLLFCPLLFCLECFPPTLSVFFSYFFQFPPTYTQS